MDQLPSSQGKIAISPTDHENNQIKLVSCIRRFQSVHATISKGSSETITF